MTSSPGAVVVTDDRGIDLLVRILWFLCIGWWLSFLVVTAAAIANLTVIGIPLGIWLMNRVPQVVTLKMDKARYTATTLDDGTVQMRISNVPQRPFWQRLLWYLLIGWWLTTIWLYIAWGLCVLIVTLPIAFPMFSAAGKLLTLKR